MALTLVAATGKIEVNCSSTSFSGEHFPPRLISAFEMAILMPDLSPMDGVPTSYAAIVTLWMAATGASIGSFLNVVVYRLPRGMSLSHPGSHCPRCRHAIRWRDNLPIFGWLLLKGRCRDCRTPISTRYPLVEALVMSIFVALLYGEYLATRSTGGMASEGFFLRYAFHLLLVITLLTAGLIEFDGQRPPLKLFVIAIVVGLVAPILWPELHPEPLIWSMTDPVAGPPLREALDKSAAGILTGIFLACLAWPITGRGGLGSYGRWVAMLELGLIGCFLGWQATAIVGGQAIGIVAFLRCLTVRQSISNVSLVLSLMTLEWIIVSPHALPFLKLWYGHSDLDLLLVSSVTTAVLSIIGHLTSSYPRISDERI